MARAVARLIPELEGWAALGEVGRKRKGTVDENSQERLVMDLLGVYMRDGWVLLAFTRGMADDVVALLCRSRLLHC